MNEYFYRLKELTQKMLNYNGKGNDFSSQYIQETQPGHLIWLLEDYEHKCGRIRQLERVRDAADEYMDHGWPATDATLEELRSALKACEHPPQEDCELEKAVRQMSDNQLIETFQDLVSELNSRVKRNCGEITDANS